MSLNRGNFLSGKREGGGGGERDRGVGERVSRQAYLRLGLGEIEGRGREIELTMKILSKAG
jgi:hypothetical protein